MWNSFLSMCAVARSSEWKWLRESPIWYFVWASTPVSIYLPSPTVCPAVLLSMVYPRRYFRWNTQWCSILFFSFEFSESLVSAIDIPISEDFVAPAEHPTSMYAPVASLLLGVDSPSAVHLDPEGLQISRMIHLITLKKTVKFSLLLLMQL